MQWWRTGDPLQPASHPRRPHFKIDPSTGCWLWQRALTDQGYSNGGHGAAHRYYWKLVYGPIPPGLHLDHLCRVRHCCNPAHLELVTPLENIRRAAPWRLKPHCRQGHEYTPENTHITKDGVRRCRECARLSQRQRRARKAAA
jgi:hypothetical protein